MAQAEIIKEIVIGSPRKPHTLPKIQSNPMRMNVQENKMQPRNNV